MRIILNYIEEECTHYKISIGGSVVLFRGVLFYGAITLRPSITMYEASQRTPRAIRPVVHFRGTGVMTIAWAAMHHLLEAERPRYSYELLNTYLASKWRQALKEMGVPPKFGEEEDAEELAWGVELTAEALKQSGILKKIKENRHAGR